MTRKQAVAYYGSVAALADALGVKVQAVYQWGDRPPMLRQYQLERMTKGALRVDRDKRVLGACAP